jgi:hypothetical protein
MSTLRFAFKFRPLSDCKHTGYKGFKYSGGVTGAPAVCLIQMRLWRERAEASLAFGRAVKELRPHLGAQNFNERLAAVNKARDECRRTRQAIADHRAKHGC